MSTPIVFSDFVHFLELVSKPQIQAVYKILNIDETKQIEQAAAVLQSYLLLKNYAPIENVIALLNNIAAKHKEPLISLVVINKSFAYSQDKSKSATLWSLETVQQVKNTEEAVPAVIEQHGVDMTAAVTLWTEKFKEYVFIRQKAEQASASASAAEAAS